MTGAQSMTAFLGILLIILVVAESWHVEWKALGG